MLTWLLIAGAVVLFGGTTIAIARARTTRPDRMLTPKRATKERTLRELLPGDIVTFEGSDLLVEGVIFYDEDGHQWRSARLLDDGKERWVLVGMDRVPGLSSPVRLLTVDPTATIQGFPPDTLTLSGREFKLNNRGHAGVSGKGDVGVSGLGTQLLRIRYWRYSGPDGAIALVEQWGNDYRTCLGTSIKEDDISLLPGS